jgi:hypothetical protein
MRVSHVRWVRRLTDDSTTSDALLGAFCFSISEEGVRLLLGSRNVGLPRVASSQSTASCLTRLSLEVGLTEDSLALNISQYLAFLQAFELLF